MNEPTYELGLRLPLVAAAVVLLLFAGCAPNLMEQRVNCDDSERVQSAHSWGSTIAVTPAATEEWYDLVEEPFRSFGLPPVSVRELEKRHGPSIRRREDKVEYELAAGTLWFQLDRERSGGVVHESWRLRFQPRSRTRLTDALNEEVLACISGLSRARYDLNILDRESRVPRVAFRIERGEVKRITWMNLGRAAGASSEATSPAGPGRG